MALMVLDLDEEKRLKAARERSGADRYDEVWDGVYMMAPLANNEHQELQTRLTSALQSAVGWNEPAIILAGANVSDREKGWIENYRIPDIVVVYPNGAATDLGTHWLGGPDFCAEIISPGDRSRDKLDFYASIGVRELLIVDREDWTLELYRLLSGRLELVGKSTPSALDSLSSAVLPVNFRMVNDEPRPRIEVTQQGGVQRWLV